ncbi:MAG TPA: hypothetical protein VF796_09305 [Humisphaera sp.]
MSEDFSAPSSSSSSSGLPEDVRSPRPVVQFDGPDHPRYFKDYPFVETVAGGTQAGNSVLLSDGSLVFRADVVTVPSLMGFTWRFGVNYHGSESARGFYGPLGPHWSFPQNVYLQPAGSLATPWVRSDAPAVLELCTGEFTSEQYVAPDYRGPFIGTISRSRIKPLDRGYKLISSDGTRTIFGPLQKLYTNGGTVHLIKSIEDRFGNLQKYSYDENGYLVSVTDPYGRAYAYEYTKINAGNFGQVTRLSSVSYPGGNQISFQYEWYPHPKPGIYPDFAPRLVAVVGPALARGAPAISGSSSNVFPNGTAYAFRYNDSGMLSRVFFPNDVERLAPPNASRIVDLAKLDAAPAGSERYRIAYADYRVESESYNSADAAGGSYRYEYTEAHPSVRRGRLVASTTVTDRNGNKVKEVFDARGLTVERSVYPNRNKVSLPAATAAYVTKTEYNDQGQPLRVEFPAGNSVEYRYESGLINSQFFSVQRRGLLSVETHRAGTRGGSGPAEGPVQTQLVTVRIYEPLFCQVYATIDARGLAVQPVVPGQPPLFFKPQNGGAVTSPRYTTRHHFDYEKRSPADVCNDDGLQRKLELSEYGIQWLIDYVNLQMDGAGLPKYVSALGDVNGDGAPPAGVRLQGSIIKTVFPSVTLAGGAVQAREEVYTTNARGQLTTRTDAEGNVHVVVRHPYGTPDGVTPTPGVPADLANKQYGFVNETRVDVDPAFVMGLVGPTGDLAAFTRIIQRDPVVQPDTGQFLDLKTTFSTYDALSNPLRVVDPRGNQFDTDRREDGTPWRQTAPAPYSTKHDILYDANGNVTAELVDDLQVDADANGHFTPVGEDTTANFPVRTGPGSAAVPGRFLSQYAYDALDNLKSSTVDARGASPALLVTAYEYDKNQNVVMATSAAGTVTKIDYDERDLPIAVMQGTGDEAAVRVMTYDVNGNLENRVSPMNFGGSGTALSVTVRGAFELPSGSPAPAGTTTTYTGDWEQQVRYDGFDRAILIEDAVGGTVHQAYDPVGNLVEALQRGMPGGATPTTRPTMPPDPALSVDLARAVHRFDEASRPYEQQADVFLNTTLGHALPSGRAVVHKPGGLLPNTLGGHDIPAVALTSGGRSSVLTRTVYDRVGRAASEVADNASATTYQYDGADRLIRASDPLLNSVEHWYDAGGNTTRTVRQERGPQSPAGGPAITAVESFETRAAYDVLNRRVVAAEQGKDGSIDLSVPPSYGSETLYTVLGYDSRNNVTVQVDPKRNTVLRVHDGAGRLLATTETFYERGDGSLPPTGVTATTARALDGDGRPTALQDANGNTTGFDYDTLGRLKKVTFPVPAQTRQFEYTKAGQVSLFTDERGTKFFMRTPAFSYYNRRAGPGDATVGRERRRARALCLAALPVRRALARHEGDRPRRR